MHFTSYFPKLIIFILTPDASRIGLFLTGVLSLMYLIAHRHTVDGTAVPDHRSEISFPCPKPELNLILAQLSSSLMFRQAVTG